MGSADEGGEMASGTVPGEGPSEEPARGYALLDAGGGRRLERFGELIVDRPAPTATRPPMAPGRWDDADLRFQPGRGWSGRAASWAASGRASGSVGDQASAWGVTIADLTMELRTTSSGGVGLYPEHAVNLPWIHAEVRDHVARAVGPNVLNLFAHTGLATLAAASAGATVAHVDAARGSVAWARRNAARNGLAGRPIRWLVDDARAFAEREARRGRRYAGVILDPPSAGHGRTGRWALRQDLPVLLTACAAISLADAFVLLTAHTMGLDGSELSSMLAAAFPKARGRVAVTPLVLRAESGAAIELGWAARLTGSAGGA